MKKVLMQESFNGEWFEIWNSDAETIEQAVSEMDEQPEIGCYVKFEGDEQYLILNGGY